MAKVREFEFTPKHFELVRKLVTEHTGIMVTDAKQDMVYSRLVRRIRQTGSENFDNYCELLSPDSEEFTPFINALTTNLTSFFRENHHFEMLADSVLPDIMFKNKMTKKIRIWSAGCSTGMEPYSIAIVVRENVPPDWDVKILATDLDTNVIATAAEGIYDYDKITGVSEDRFNTWFRRGSGANSDKVKVSKKLKELITYKQLNLLHDFPFSGPIDIIFCRNVVIYFDKLTQSILFDKFAKVHRNKGYLFIGHSETLYNVTKQYKLHSNTMYTKEEF